MNTPAFSHLTRCIAKRSDQQQAALVPFITAGIPNREQFWDTLVELTTHGADIIEIGVPFSDPVADGPVVAQASEQALEMGVNLSYILEGLKKRKHLFGATGIVLMGYANPFLQYGWPVQEGSKRLHGVEKATALSLEALCEALAQAGVHGLIIPDLPFEESGVWRQKLGEKGLDLIPLVGLNTSAERMRLYAKEATGYVYVVAVLGTTGVRSGFDPQLEATLLRAQECFNLPLALGFGLEHPRQLKAIPPRVMPQALVFGSALIKHLQSGQSAASFMQPWQEDRQGRMKS